jgi:hypothetical protein
LDILTSTVRRSLVIIPTDIGKNKWTSPS